MRNVTQYTDEQKEHLLKAFREWTGKKGDFFKAHDVLERTLYGWIARAKKKSGSEAVGSPVAQEPVEGLEFNIVQASEARLWIGRNMSGRFSVIKEAMLSQVNNLRKNQALAFQAPKDAKEAHALHHACYSAIKKAGLPYGVSYARGKGLIVVMRRESGEKS